MKNPGLAMELEKIPIVFPMDWRDQLFTIDSPRWHDYTDAVIHNLGMLLKNGGALNAMHAVSIASITIFKMIKASYPKESVVASYQIAPEFLAILIADLQTRRNAIECFNLETTEIVNAYFSRG